MPVIREQTTRISFRATIWCRRLVGHVTSVECPASQNTKYYAGFSHMALVEYGV